MSELDELRRDVDQAIARLAFYSTILDNIANGYWNAGRREPITAEEYARQALTLSWHDSAIRRDT